jgi:hypothetical protein
MYAENDLTCLEVESLEKLDATRHCICCDEAKVDDHLKVVGKEG